MQLLYSVEDGVAQVRFNRPEQRNALNHAVRQALQEVFDEIADADEVRAVVIAGAGNDFAAGADIAEQAGRDTRGAMEAFTTRAIADCRKPVIAAVNGFALGGGCEFAMQADFIIASDGAQFGQPEIRLGIVPGAGGTQRLARLVGRQNALYMLMSASMITAVDAQRMGLVAEVVEGDAVPRATEIARRIAKLPPVTARHIKACVTQGLDMPLDGALAFERQAYAMMFSTADLGEGIAAFMEKRKPSFTGA